MAERAAWLQQARCKGGPAAGWRPDLQPTHPQPRQPTAAETAAAPAGMRTCGDTMLAGTAMISLISARTSCDCGGRAEAGRSRRQSRRWPSRSPTQRPAGPAGAAAQQPSGPTRSARAPASPALPRQPHPHPTHLRQVHVHLVAVEVGVVGRGDRQVEAEGGVGQDAHAVALRAAAGGRRRAGASGAGCMRGRRSGQRLAPASSEPAAARQPGRCSTPPSGQPPPAPPAAPSWTSCAARAGG